MTFDPERLLGLAVKGRPSPPLPNGGPSPRGGERARDGRPDGPPIPTGSAVCPHCGCTVPVVAIEGRYWWVPASVPQLQAQLERAQAGADRLRTSMRAFAQMFEREAIEIRE